MISVVKVALLLFAGLGFVGVGAAWAVGRARELQEGENDLGMRALACALAMFSAACTMTAVGLVGVLAFGGVVVWCSYVICAQHVGVFRIETAEPRESEPASR